MRMTVGDCQVVSAFKTSPTGGDVGTLGVGDVLPALVQRDSRRRSAPAMASSHPARSPFNASSRERMTSSSTSAGTSSPSQP